MKTLVNIAIVIGIISLVTGIISRLTMTPIPIIRGGLEAQALIVFANTCFLIAITFILLKSKQ